MSSPYETLLFRTLGRRQRALDQKRAEDQQFMQQAEQVASQQHDLAMKQLAYDTAQSRAMGKAGMDTSHLTGRVGELGQLGAAESAAASRAAEVEHAGKVELANIPQTGADRRQEFDAGVDMERMLMRFGHERDMQSNRLRLGLGGKDGAQYDPRKSRTYSFAQLAKNNLDAVADAVSRTPGGMRQVALKAQLDRARRAYAIAVQLYAKEQRIPVAEAKQVFGLLGGVGPTPESMPNGGEGGGGTAPPAPQQLDEPLQLRKPNLGGPGSINLELDF